MPISARGRTTVALVIAIALLLSACGGGSPSKTAASAAPTTSATTTSTTTTAPPTTTDAATTTSSTPTTVGAPGTLPPDTQPAPTEPATTLPPATTAPAGPMAAAISISGFAFHPPSVTVARGGTVTTTNNDMTTHTWTGNDGSWSSGNLGPGASFSHTFAAPGTYAFHCAIHPSMTGSVTVT